MMAGRVGAPVGGNLLKRAVAFAAACVFSASCGGVDRQKFDRVYTAGNALLAEVQSNVGRADAKARDRLKEFDAAIAALQDRAIGIQEVNALHAYSEAADAYRSFLRFRAIDVEADSREILLKGPNLEAATRFRLPVDSRGGKNVVDRARALTILLQAGEQHLSDGNRIVGR